ncbi:hypothetical protein RI129_004548 [Pyrocoelia pectoralis]|uniref:THAP-type domain-containing protein n=1 Tax=Pyrocoelia pectoralis TaxID=417401 RepID=A0AAN7VLQ7_9COLE
MPAMTKSLCCSYFQCFRNRVTHPELSFFRFPSKKERSDMWLENCGNSELDLYSLKELNKKIVCGVHFAAEQFTNTLRNRLVHNAVPIHYKNDTSATPASPDRLLVNRTETFRSYGPKRNLPNAECLLECRSADFHQSPTNLIYQWTITSNLLKPPQTANCEADDDISIDIEDIPEIPTKNKVDEDNVPKETNIIKEITNEERENEVVPVVDDVGDISNLEECATVYLAGYVVNRTLKKFNCESCRKLSSDVPLRNSNELLLIERDYSKDGIKQLTIPTEIVSGLIATVSDEQQGYLI